MGEELPTQQLPKENAPWGTHEYTVHCSGGENNYEIACTYTLKFQIIQWAQINIQQVVQKTSRAGKKSVRQLILKA